ncbi:MAG: efflux RND transporter periplasmic adaptor subunit [Bacteroidetes bacterium]|nr:efflux RND transporter periplasmic adaptor subunit [Bacteroidota bacterium]
MKKKITYSIIAVILIAAAGFYFLGNSKSSEINYRFEKVTRGDIQISVSATGTLSAVKTVLVGTQVSGIIQKLYVDFNDRVHAGQVIAQIDPTFLEASVKDAEASLQRTQAQLNKSKRNFERVKTLMDKNLAAQADYDAALADYESSEAQNKQADAQLDRAKINLRYATIKAPIDGVVISRAVDVGQTVAASLSAPTIFTIANDLTKMQVQASVDEADIGKVQVGQDVTFTVDAYADQVFKGKVRQVRLDPVTSQNVVSYIVIIDVPNEELKLMPGMTATVTILVTKKESVLKVPTIALRFTPPQDQIEVKKDTSANGNGGAEDSVRAERRKQWTQNGGGFSGGGNFNPQDMERRMAARGIGRLWILNSHKKLESVMVRTGLSDGTFTEIVRGKIEEGGEIVVGTIVQRPESAGGSPFQQQRSGGRPRF